MTDIRDRFKTNNFYWKSKQSFEWVIKLIINKYFMNLFYYIFFLFLAIRSLFFTVQAFDLLFILNYSLKSINN